jgi:hypothetical protein
MRHVLTRRAVRAPITVADDYELKIVDTFAEFEAAARVLHDSYVEMGYMEKQASGMRITKYHLMPTTTIVVAKYRGEVIGTVSMIKDSPLGLPSDDIINMDSLRCSGARVAEGSSIAVVPKHRDGRVMFLLMKYLHNYLAQHAAVRYLVVSVNPRHEDLYAGVLLFEKLHGSVIDDYAFANGAAAIPMVLDLKHAQDRIRQAYKHQCNKSSLYNFMFVRSLDQLVFPSKQARYANHSGMCIEWIRELDKRALITPILADPSVATLLQLSYSSDVTKIKDGLKSPSLLFNKVARDRRIGELWAVNCCCVLLNKLEKKIIAACRLYCAFDDHIEVAFENGTTDYPQNATLSVGRDFTENIALARVSRNRRAHYKVVKPSGRWSAFVDSIKNRNVDGDTMMRDDAQAFSLSNNRRAHVAT